MLCHSSSHDNLESHIIKIKKYEKFFREWKRCSHSKSLKVTEILLVLKEDRVVLGKEEQALVPRILTIIEIIYFNFIETIYISDSEETGFIFKIILSTKEPDSNKKKYFFEFPFFEGWLTHRY